MNTRPTKTELAKRAKEAQPHKDALYKLGFLSEQQNHVVQNKIDNAKKGIGRVWNRPEEVV